MGKGRRVVARCGTRALVVATVAAGGLAAVATPAFAAPPTITSVVVPGSTNKVVTAGTTILITGTGFNGMVDNAAPGGSCNAAPAAWPASPSGCSQVRFVGVSPTASTGYTLATKYNVVSDTQIYATVPTVTPSDGTTAGAPAAGTGSMRVQVVNSMGGAVAGGLSVSSASEVFYRHPLTADITGTVNANPNGGGQVTVGVTGVAPLATVNQFNLEKITAYVSSGAVAGTPMAAAVVERKDNTNVTVTLPPGTPDGDFVSVMLVHDGVAGTADSNAVKYPAVISSVQSCSSPSSAGGSSDFLTWVTTPTSTLPTCTGTANAPTSGNAGYKITGKGFAGSSAATWSFEGAGTGIVESCVVISDSLAYCHIAVTTPPASGVSAVTFTPVVTSGGSNAPTLVPTAGSVVLFNTLI